MGGGGTKEGNEMSLLHGKSFLSSRERGKKIREKEDHLPTCRGEEQGKSYPEGGGSARAPGGGWPHLLGKEGCEKEKKKKKGVDPKEGGKKGRGKRAPSINAGSRQRGGWKEKTTKLGKKEEKVKGKCPFHGRKRAYPTPPERKKMKNAWGKNKATSQVVSKRKKQRVGDIERSRVRNIKKEWCREGGRSEKEVFNPDTVGGVGEVLAKRKVSKRQRNGNGGYRGGSALQWGVSPLKKNRAGQENAALASKKVELMGKKAAPKPLEKKSRANNKGGSKTTIEGRRNN